MGRLELYLDGGDDSRALEAFINRKPVDIQCPGIHYDVEHESMKLVMTIEDQVIHVRRTLFITLDPNCTLSIHRCLFYCEKPLDAVFHLNRRDGSFVHATDNRVIGANYFIRTNG